MKSFKQHLYESFPKTNAEVAAYVQSLQLKLSTDNLTPEQLKDLAQRSRGIASSPALLSAHADVDNMLPHQLQQVIDHKRVSVFVKHRARQRLAGKWK